MNDQKPIAMSADLAARLRSIRERVEKATKGPWTTQSHEFNSVQRSGICASIDGDGSHLAETWDDFEAKDERELADGAAPKGTGLANAEFIAHARQDIPFLLDVIASLPRQKSDQEHTAPSAPENPKAEAAHSVSPRSEFLKQGALMSGCSWRCYRKYVEDGFNACCSSCQRIATALEDAYLLGQAQASSLRPEAGRADVSVGESRPEMDILLRCAGAEAACESFAEKIATLEAQVRALTDQLEKWREVALRAARPIEREG